MVAKLKIYGAADVVALRRSLHLTQAEFWTSLYITQPAGSRYENGRRIPSTVQVLLNVGYGTQQQSAATVERMRSAGLRGLRRARESRGVGQRPRGVAP